MRYHNITKDDMLNGDGLRVVLWTAGCEHRCPGCHNQITWDEQGGLPFGEAETDEIYAELEHDYISGITFTGGDPLHPSNRSEIARIAREIKQRFPHKTIWLYTGYLWEDVKDLEAVRLSDVVVDGRFEQDKLDPKLHWRGSSNQRVIDVEQSLKSGGVVLYCD